MVLAEEVQEATLKGEGSLWGKAELADPCDLASMPNILIFASHLYYLIFSRYCGVQLQSTESALV